MNKTEEEPIGYIGCFLLITSFTPQIYKTFKTKNADDLSALSLLFQILTTIFSFTYAVIIDANPIILSNSIVFFELLFLFYASIYFKRSNDVLKISYI